MASSNADERALRVVYVHLSGQLGGAPRSLMELISGFPAGAVDATILTPRGPVTAEFERAKIRCVPVPNLALFDNTRYSYYRGIRWLVLLREIARIPQTLYSLYRYRHLFNAADIVHANDALLLFPMALIARFFRQRIVVHVRSVQRVKRNWRRKLFDSVLERCAVAVIPIDETVERSLKPSRKIHVVHNGIVNVPPDTVKAEDNSTICFGMVGNINRAKGCMEFVDAAIRCHSRCANARFAIVGARPENTPGLLAWFLKRIGLYQSIDNEIRTRISVEGLEDLIVLRPFTPDLSAIYRALDVICFPSHLDAPGRPVFEAAFFGIPSIAAISQPTADTFVDGETGIRIDAGSLSQLAEAMALLSTDHETRVRLGRNARRLAEKNFDSKKNARRVLEVYRDSISAVRR